MPRKTVTVDPAFGVVLRELRIDRGMTQRELGQISSYTHTYLWELESGRKRPTATTAAVLDQALQADGRLAGLVSDSAEPVPPVPATVDLDSESGWGNMLRRTMVLGPTATIINRLTGGSVPAFHIPKPRVAVSVDTVAGLAAVAGHYRRAYHDVPASPLLSAALAHLELVMSLRPFDQPSQQRNVLITTAGEMAALVGVLLGLDADQQRAALAYLDLAWSAARDVGSIELQAVVLGCRSFALAFTGDHQAGLECVDFAREVAAGGANPQTRGWLDAVASERCASLGDLAGCQHRLEDAHTALAAPESEVAWRGVGGFSHQKLRAYEGGDLVRLGRWRQATSILDKAVDQFDDGQPRHRATALIDRAEAHLGAGDIGQACTDATAALGLVTAVQHTTNLARIQAVASRSLPTGANVARQLQRDVQLVRVDNGLPTRWET
jgi:transcriptional regulator with XRE-family HTH domain